jgi:queuine tRNA-ribosyltransferase
MRKAKRNLQIKNSNIKFPIFLPDATRGISKHLDSEDLVNHSVRGVVVNTFHLKHTPGVEALRKAGGIKKFMNYNGLVVSDSGGWQVFSLIHRNDKNMGHISKNGVVFELYGKKELFTPEISIRTQFDIGADIIICLDDFVPPKASYEETKKVVERTVNWAKKSKEEFDRIVNKKKIAKNDRPLLFSVIQGGDYKDLRKECAMQLTKIGFDGYGFGGYAVDNETHKLDLEISEYIADLIPDTSYRFALGVGRPDDIAALHKMGWEMFDCTLPTRDARHKRLYVFSKNPLEIDFETDTEFYSYIYINKSMYKNDFAPVSEHCDCLTCKNYSRAYLHHLFKIKDGTALRLATIHNLRFYTRLIELLM